MKTYCNFCADEVDIEKPHISMVGWGFAKTKSSEIIFHENCFEQVAGEDYTNTLRQFRVDPEGQPIGKLAQEKCQNCLSRPVDLNRKKKGTPYCSYCPPAGQECATVGCDQPKKMSSYYCRHCLERRYGTRTSDV